VVEAAVRIPSLHAPEKCSLAGLLAPVETRRRRSEPPRAMEMRINLDVSTHLSQDRHVSSASSACSHTPKGPPARRSSGKGPSLQFSPREPRISSSVDHDSLRNGHSLAGGHERASPRTSRDPPRERRVTPRRTRAHDQARPIPTEVDSEQQKRAGAFPRRSQSPSGRHRHGVSLPTTSRM
jgi:hypothetical protein